MSTQTQTVAHLDHSVAFRERRQAAFRVVRAWLDGLARLISSLQAAQAVVRRADYYYSLGNQELARLGLSREDVPRELIRELDELQGR